MNLTADLLSLDSRPGIRGAGSPFAPQVFDQSLPDYIASANRNTFIGVQIETVEGVEHCEEIAKVDGIGELLGRRSLRTSQAA